MKNNHLVYADSCRIITVEKKSNTNKKLAYNNKDLNAISRAEFYYCFGSGVK
jgi:hypothetical protein